MIHEEATIMLVSVLPDAFFTMAGVDGCQREMAMQERKAKDKTSATWRSRC